MQAGLLGSGRNGFIKSVGRDPGLQFRSPEIDRSAASERSRTSDDHERLIGPAVIHQLLPADQGTADFVIAGVGAP